MAFCKVYAGPKHTNRTLRTNRTAGLGTARQMAQTGRDSSSVVHTSTTMRGEPAMINEEYQGHGLAAKSVIRELSEVRPRAARAEFRLPETCSITALANPSVPASEIPSPTPWSTSTKTAIRWPSHGLLPLARYPIRQGRESPKTSTKRYRMASPGNHSFPDHGRGGRAVPTRCVPVTKAGDEIITFAPYFPELLPAVRQGRPAAS